MFRLVHEMAADGIPVAVACRVLNVSTSGFYEWRDRPPRDRAVADAELVETITDIHAGSRGTYGVRRVHAELRLGRGTRVCRKRVERLMRNEGLAGVHRRRWRRHQPAPAVHDDLVNRQFVANGPDRLWVTDITQHRSGEGWIYCAVVLDVFSRRAVGWSIADHLRTDLVVDALDMARWRRRPDHGQTVVHSDRGAQAGLNRSSQHPDRRVLSWDLATGRSRFVSTGVRWARVEGRRSRGDRTASLSGLRSVQGFSRTRRRWWPGCRLRSATAGSVTLAG